MTALIHDKDRALIMPIKCERVTNGHRLIIVEVSKDEAHIYPRGDFRLAGTTY